MSQSKFWVYTLNNPEVPTDWTDKCKYAVYQNEVGENGTPHEQGYIELARSQRLSYVRKLLSKAHWEPRRGTAQDARDYCMSTGKHSAKPRVSGPFEYGTFTNERPGKRNDVELIHEEIKAGKTNFELWEEHFSTMARIHKAVDRYRMESAPQRDPSTPPEVTVIIGPTGSGKTKYISDKEPLLYWKQQSKWWDQYRQEPAVILDEFKGWLPFTELLRLLDRYPIQVEQKGSQMQFNSPRIYLTSNYHPEDWYKNREYLPALYRRITHLYWLDDDEPYEVTPDELRGLVSSRKAIDNEPKERFGAHVEEYEQQ